MQKIATILILAAVMIFGVQANIVFNDSQPVEFMTNIEMNNQDINNAGNVNADTVNANSLTVSSNSIVNNLNADLIDGKELADLDVSASLSEVLNEGNDATTNIDMRSNNIENVNKINGKKLSDLESAAALSPVDLSWYNCQDRSDGSPYCSASCGSGETVVGYAQDTDAGIGSSCEYPTTVSAKYKKGGHGDSVGFSGSDGGSNNCLKATLVCGPSGAQYTEVTETYSNSWNLGDCCNSASDTWSATQNFGGEYEIKNGMFYATFNAAEFDNADITMTLTAYNSGTAIGNVQESFSLEGRYNSYESKSMNLASLPDQPVTDVEFSTDVTVSNEDDIGVDLKWDFIRTPY